MADMADEAKSDAVVPAEDRLARIEMALAQLAAQQAAGPPPDGYSARKSAPSANGPVIPLSMAFQAAQAAGYLPGSDSAKKSWLDWPVIREFRLVTRMYFDPRYSPTRAAQLGVPAIFLILVANYLFWAYFFTFPVLAHLGERIILMIAAIVLFRILSMEVARYGSVLDYLKKSGR